MNTKGDIMVHSGVFSALADIMSTSGNILINVGEGYWENNSICYCTEHPSVLVISSSGGTSNKKCWGVRVLRVPNFVKNYTTEYTNSQNLYCCVHYFYRQGFTFKNY